MFITYMGFALAEAKKAFAKGAIPVGAVIVLSHREARIPNEAQNNFREDVVFSKSPNTPEDIRFTQNAELHADQNAELHATQNAELHANIVARAHNESGQPNLPLPPPLQHAEFVALVQASVALKQDRLDNCDLYTTLEPCYMCFAAISLMRVRKVVFGAYDLPCGALSRGWGGGAFNNAPEVIGGIMDDECSKILREFFKAKR
jgi:tRNA(adenine34) deaminase